MKIKELFNVHSAVLAKAREETAKDYKSKNKDDVEADLDEDLNGNDEEDVVGENGDVVG